MAYFSDNTLKFIKTLELAHKANCKKPQTKDEIVQLIKNAQRSNPITKLSASKSFTLTGIAKNVPLYFVWIYFSAVDTDLLYTSP